MQNLVVQPNRFMFIATPASNLTGLDGVGSSFSKSLSPPKAAEERVYIPKGGGGGERERERKSVLSLASYVCMKDGMPLPMSPLSQILGSLTRAGSFKVTGLEITIAKHCVIFLITNIIPSLLLPLSYLDFRSPEPFARMSPIHTIAEARNNNKNRSLEFACWQDFCSAGTPRQVEVLRKPNGS